MPDTEITACPYNHCYFVGGCMIPAEFTFHRTDQFLKPFGYSDAWTHKPLQGQWLELHDLLLIEAGIK